MMDDAHNTASNQGDACEGQKSAPDANNYVNEQWRPVTDDDWLCQLQEQVVLSPALGEPIMSILQAPRI